MKTYIVVTYITIGLVIIIYMLLLLSGCASSTNIKVISAPKSQVTVRHLDVEPGDTVICDNSGCRILQ